MGYGIIIRILTLSLELGEKNDKSKYCQLGQSVVGPAGGNQGISGVWCCLQKNGVGFSPPVCGALGVIGLSGRAYL